MARRETTVINRSGLHARPASEFVQLAKTYKECRITIENLDIPDEEPVNAKSIISVLSLGMGVGAKVAVSANGEREQEAVDSLIALIDSGFGE